MPNDKIQALGTINQLESVSELALKEFKLLYNNSQVRLPIEDVEFVKDRIRATHKNIEEISIINKQFEQIAVRTQEV